MYNQFKKYNSIFILFGFFLLCGNISAQQGWFNLNVPFGGGGIFFKDLNNGIIGEYKTTNAGQTWLNMGINSGGTSISFPAPNTGYGIYAASIKKTTDFGNNWTYLYYPSNLWAYGVFFPNVNIGFICGGAGALYKTTNGGSNWFTLITPIFYQSYKFEDVFFIDTLTGYLAGHTGSNDTSVFLKTTNGGINWSAQFYQVIAWGSFSSMFFINANTGFIGTATGAKILKTTNGGVTWYESFLPTANRINDIFFPSGPIGYACCFGGQILKTTDSGYNWFLQTTGTGSNLNRLFFLNNLTGYCAGEFAVLKTTDGGGPPIGINPISNEIPEDFRLEQNYPNPFNPVTKIRFSIPLVGAQYIEPVRLVVYDILGREAGILVNEQLMPGIYEVIWVGSKFSSGVYFYRIIAGDFVKTNKMILVK